MKIEFSKRDRGILGILGLWTIVTLIVVACLELPGIAIAIAVGVLFGGGTVFMLSMLAYMIVSEWNDY